MAKDPISKRISVEIALGKIDLVREPALANIPTPGDDIASLKKTLTAIKTLLDSKTGVGGTSYDQWVSVRDLTDTGTINLTGTISGNGGGGGSGTPGVDDPRPFLTTPPTPTNLAAQGSYKHIILTWDLVSYRNHSYTEVYRATVNSLGSAVKIGQSESTMFADSTGVMSTVYYYWVRAVGYSSTGVVITGAFNAVGGTAGGLGLVGNVDLGPLIVEAGNLASGAVTASKIAAAAVDLTKFANGIEPVTIITSGALPTSLLTQTIFYTDKKLYRWNGTAYVKDTPASDISGTIVASQVALAIGGGNLLQNSSFEAKASGNQPSGYSAYSSAPGSYSAPAGRLSGTAFGLVASGAGPTVFGLFTDLSMVAGIVTGGATGGWKPNTTYVVSWWAKKVNGSSWSGMQLNWNTTPASTTAISNPALTSSYQRYVSRITWGASVENIGALFVTVQGTTVSGDEIHIDDIQIEEGDTVTAWAPRATEILPGTITTTTIADDAITTSKIVAGAIVTGKIAAGAVTADKILANSITAAQIAAGTITAAQIASDTITAGQIAAGAIGASEIVANAISTDKLLVTGRGRAMNDDPLFTDTSAWTVAGAGTTFGLGSAPVGSTYVQNATGGSNSTVNSRRMPLDPTKLYKLKANIYADGANDRNMYLYVRMFTSAGTELTGIDTGWGGSFAGYVFGSVPPSGWSEQGAQFGPGTGRPIPSNAAFCEVGIWFQYSGSGSSSVNQACQNLRLEETVGADLIVDGAIIASKIAANAIAVGSAAIQNGAIRNALIENAAVDTAKIADASIVTAKIADAQITTAKIQDAQITEAKIMDANITAAKIQDASISTAKIQDAAITAAKIQDANITTAKIADGQITTAKIGDAQVTSAKVGVLTAGNLTVGAISDTVNGGLGSGNARIVITSNAFTIYNSANAIRVLISA